MQIFVIQGVVSNVTDNLLDSPVSGLLGLAFQGISSSRAIPFWQSLVKNAGTLDSPVMAFQLTRFVNDSGVRTVEIGGTFTLGATNESLYTGDIDFNDVPSDAVAYWTIPMSSKQASCPCRLYSVTWGSTDYPDYSDYCTRESTEFIGDLSNIRRH